MTIQKWAFVLILAVLLVPATVEGGDYDGSKPLVCAIMEVVECDADGCEIDAPFAHDIPYFINIDFKKKLLSGKQPNGAKLTTTIDKLTSMESQLVLQGIQNGKAWSIVLDDETGRMTLTAVDTEVAFVVYGGCIPK